MTIIISGIHRRIAVEWRVTRKNGKRCDARCRRRLNFFQKKRQVILRDLWSIYRQERTERYDYREFLRKFSVLKEEMQVDMDSFDPIYYNLGLELYGNMPLIEPLETKEMKKIEDFVIVLDTSMSCNGSLIRRFLEETYSVLSESESFFRKIQVHIIQCDERFRMIR
mgnify:CR=1 FL=1